jgi:hypothetical protein
VSGKVFLDDVPVVGATVEVIGADLLADDFEGQYGLTD